MNNEKTLILHNDIILIYVFDYILRRKVKPPKLFIVPLPQKILISYMHYITLHEKFLITIFARNILFHQKFRAVSNYDYSTI